MYTDPRSVAFLQSLQSDLQGPLPENPPQVDTEKAQSASTASSGEVGGAGGGGSGAIESPPPTPYETAVGYSILSELTSDIVAALREDVKLADPPLVGTLPIGAPTALLLRVPGSSGHIALIDRQFTIFANLLAKACAQALIPPAGDDSPQAWEAGLQNGLHPAVQRFLELGFATMTGSPVTAPAYLPAPELSGLLSPIRTAIEAFVVSEPFVHLGLGHAVDAPSLPLPALHPRAESYDWTPEQRAESFVMRLGVVGWIFDKYGYPDKALGYWSIQMLLFTLVLLSAVDAKSRGGTAPKGTWPQTQLEWLKLALVQSEGEHSRTVALCDRLSPIPLAFARHFELAVTHPSPGVH